MLTSLFHLTSLVLACGQNRSGDEGARTPNPRLAKAVLSQLSYVPDSSVFEYCNAMARCVCFVASLCVALVVMEGTPDVYVMPVNKPETVWNSKSGMRRLHSADLHAVASGTVASCHPGIG